MRRASKVDDNQSEIIKVFKGLGYSVAVTSLLGRGFPDIVCGKQDRNFLIEIKDGSKPPSARKLTQDEKGFQALWRGQYDVIKSLNDVLDFEKREFGRPVP